MTSIVQFVLKDTCTTVAQCYDSQLHYRTGDKVTSSVNWRVAGHFHSTNEAIQAGFITTFYRGKKGHVVASQIVSLLLTSYITTSRFAISICKAQKNSATNTYTKLQIRGLEL